MIKKGQHFLDIPVNGKKRKRTIKNNYHYRAPINGKSKADDNDEWIETHPNGKIFPASISNWTGKIDMMYASLDAPLQAFAGDTTDLSNTALYGCRLSEEPNTWINWKAYEPIPNVRGELLYDGEDLIGATWRDLWTDADLEVIHAIHKAVKIITIKTSQASNSYGFTVKIAPSHTLELIDNSYFVLKNPQEEIKLKTEPIWAVDNDNQNLRVSIEEGGAKGKTQLYYLVINQEDFNNATFPIKLDPTTTISGTGAIEDCGYYAAAPPTGDWNLGTATECQIGTISGAPNGAWIRIAKTALPLASNVTSFTAYTYTSGRVETRNARWFLLTAANDGVLEGTTNYAPQNGSMCYTYKAYDTTTPTPWAGSAGAQTSGVDYEADASPPSNNGPGVAASTEITYTLKPTWVTNVIDGIRNELAMIIIGTTGGRGSSFRSTEYATTAYQPHFDIEYTEIAGLLTTTVDYHSVEDTCMTAGGIGDYNWGNVTNIYIGNNDTYRGLFKFDKTLIPAGTIISVSLIAYNAQSSPSVIRCHAIKDANTWVEGSSGGGVQN